jgi:competence protein ComEC
MSKIIINKRTLIILAVLTAIVGFYSFHWRNQCDSRPTGKQIVTADLLTITPTSPSQSRLVFRDMRTDKMFQLQSKSDQWQIGDGYLLDIVPITEEAIFDGFNYDKYLAQRGICYRAELNGSDSFKVADRLTTAQVVSELRSKIEASLKADYSLNTTGLVVAVITGHTHLFSVDLEEDFSSTGITHLVAVSGANFALVVTIISFAFNGLQNKWRLSGKFVVALCYMALVGLSNLPALRAFTFLSTELLTRFTGIYVHPFQKLIIALLAIHLIKPYAFLDIGFQLSITAWLVVKVVLGEFLDRSGVPAGFLRDEIAASALGTALLLPVTIAFFGEANLLSVLYNAVLVPSFSVFNLAALIAVLTSPFLPRTIVNELFDQVSNLLVAVIETFSRGEIWIVAGSAESTVMTVIWLLAIAYIFILKLIKSNEVNYFS